MERSEQTIPLKNKIASSYKKLQVKKIDIAYIYKWLLKINLRRVYSTYLSMICAMRTCPLPQAPATCVPSLDQLNLNTLPVLGFSNAYDHCNRRNNIKFIIIMIINNDKFHNKTNVQYIPDIRCLVLLNENVAKVIHIGI